MRATLGTVNPVAQVKLQPTPEQAVALKDTLCHANAACNHMSAVAYNRYEGRRFNRLGPSS